MSERPVEFTPADFVALCGFGQRLHVSEGETIFRSGDVDRSMLLIEQGTVELVFAGKGSKLLGPGEYFGELAFLIGEHRRSATATAKSDCELVLADQTTIDTLLARSPRLLFALLRHACTYLLESEEGLIADLQRKNSELERTLDFLRRTREELDVRDLQAHTDALTGLYNRRCLDEQLPKALDRARAWGNGLALLMLDLDGFKQVNDTLGHAQGDRVLTTVASILTRHTRKSDLPCRLGGDEFAVVLPGIPERRAREVAENIRKGVREAFAGDGPKVSSSIGVVMFGGAETAEQLLARADSLLYEAKRQGKDRVCCAGFQ